MMDAVRRDIISRLERDILPLEGLKSSSTDNHISLGFRPIETAFPNAVFPVGCVHEFLSSSKKDVAATNGFIAFLLNKLMLFNGASIWISASRTLFPAALKQFDIDPQQIIFIDLKKEKDVLYAFEEALKCNRLSTVVGEIKEISFKESRRLQLAAEQSRVTGFLVRHQPKVVNTIACVSRWRIASFPSELADGMPGVGFPRYNVELLKVRNGKLGTWQLEWSYNQLHEVKQNIFSIPQEQVRKTG
jgi:protein ImuA